MRTESEWMLNGRANGVGHYSVNPHSSVPEEPARRLALLDAYQRFVLDHPQDTVLAVDTSGQM
jgi:hypothetical protein